MSYSLNDAQREILGREMQSAEIDNWVRAVWDAAETTAVGSGDAAVEAKISIIESAKAEHSYDEMRRRAYPAIGDQLDALYHAGVFPDAMADQIKAVKDANPK